MRLFLSLSLVFVITTAAAAQFGKTPSTRMAKATDTTTRKTTDRTHTDRATKAADQAGADTDLANKLLAIIDTDGDGTVTKLEFNKAMAALHKMHKDAKGNITYDKPAEDNANAAAGADPAQGAGAGAGPQQQEAGRFMQQYDRNGDGVLTPDELPPQLAAALREADTNHDRRIDAAELAAFAAKMGDRMRAMNGAAGQGGVPGDGRRPLRNENK